MCFLKVNYKYASSSVCVKKASNTVLGFSSDLSRDEKVSFSGKLKSPLVFRDAMLMLREIVVSDLSQKKKERVEFFAWLEQEIERRSLEKGSEQLEIRERLEQETKELTALRDKLQKQIDYLVKDKKSLAKEIDKYDIWKEYYKIEREFWKFIRERDMALWWVLDPVITVHKDQVSFEAFSLDESTYGCLSIPMEEFELLEEPKFGTTNIDFSLKLAREMERFRTYTDVTLSINPEGFTVDSQVLPEHLEKKIDLPESWIKGFNQVSAAASLKGVDIELSPIDMYDICSVLRRNKDYESPRYMKWILQPGKPVKIILEPFHKELTLKTIYTGQKAREEKIWGKRRWLVMERLIPLAQSFKVRLLGFGMPQFIVADLGSMKMTVGFSSWTSNDWVKGTAFNVLSNFIGEENYNEVYRLLKENRSLTIEDIKEKLNEMQESKVRSGIGALLKRGEAYYDPINDHLRFRQLCNTPIPKELYETSPIEKEVQKLIDEPMDNLVIRVTEENEYIISKSFNIPNPRYHSYSARGTEDYDRQYNLSETKIVIDQDGQISNVDCKCKAFKRGSRNISQPCSHILAVYAQYAKFFKLELKPGCEYKMSDIMEMLL